MTLFTNIVLRKPNLLALREVDLPILLLLLEPQSVLYCLRIIVFLINDLRDFPQVKCKKK